MLAPEQRRPVPAETRTNQLVDISQPRPPYEPLDSHMIFALKEARRDLSGAVQQVSQEDKLPPVNVLAISGGGAYGAFDVGVLAGWSASGARPVFDLKKKIGAAITPKLLKAVAKEHEQGRRLYVGTTDLDTRRFVIWDMGAIAASGKPGALELYRKITLASGSVPGFFPPVLIDVEIDQVKYQEMHVDGGASASVFVPMALAKCDPRTACRRPGSCVYVISSGKLYADSVAVKRQFVNITVDAISSMLYAGARNDVFRIFNMALFCGMDFQLIAIPPEFALKANSLDIDPQELRRLFELGFEMGKTRNGWRQTPPGTEASEQVLPRTGTKFRTDKEPIANRNNSTSN
jgi:hypothetical protein